MVAVLRYQNMRQQTRSGHASGNGPARRGGLNDDVANRTGEFRANVRDDTETGGDVLKHFCHILAKFLEHSATVRAATIYRQMLDRLARQMIGQGFALRFGRYARFCFCSGFSILVTRGRLVARLLGARTFKFFEGEFELGDRVVHLLGTTTKLHATKFGDDELEKFDFGLLCDVQRLEQSGGIGQ